MLEMNWWQEKLDKGEKKKSEDETIQENMVANTKHKRSMKANKDHGHKVKDTEKVIVPGVNVYWQLKNINKTVI